jgi:GT2 family glycosyltransferase/glycosyltransferase involved in cell wall biosynthesis
LNLFFQKLTYIDNNIIKIDPHILSKSEKKIAIVVHVFYIDLWDEISSYLNQLDANYDMYVTVPETMSEEDISKIFFKKKDINIYMVENRGRDVLPFLQVMSIIPEKNYAYICKLHTKKTGDSPLGNVWRKLLYFDLLGSNKTVQNIVKMFDENNSIGIITGKNTILDSQRYAYGNDDKIDYLAEKTNIIYNDHYLFPAGTMFWIRSELLQPLIDLFKNGALEFEEEKGQKDDTLAHAIERFFGILCQDKGQSIVPSPATRKELDESTIDELSNLILGQQYAGVDMFVKQKHAIEEKDQYIQNLEALAESMRIKNRLKRLFPSNLKEKSSKIVSLLKVIKTNPQILKKAFYYLMRGDIAYLWSKTKEKSSKNITQASELLEVTPSDFFEPLDKKKYQITEHTIDIIIPVYNGYEFLEKLFDSVEQNSSAPYRLIVINDCSPDERVKPYLLKRLKKHANAVFIDHEKNQGFLKSVNEAYTYTSYHFLLLNTDTEVPPFWIERLMYPIISMDKIASTTPFTNSGEIASFPNFVADNNIFDHMDVTSLDYVFQQVNTEKFYEAIPTGVGFCMGVNHTLSKQIGMFAKDTFGKGYGEENDWCQRAIKVGYSNLLVPNLFVYHKHGGSFSAEEKAKLLKENAIKLLDRHPNYGKDVDTYIKRDPHKSLRHMLVLMAANQKVGTHLIFDHDLGGGANIYADELVDNYRRKKLNTLYIKYDFYTDTFKLFHSYKKYTFAIKISTLDELQILLSMLEIKEIFLNSIVSFKNSINILKYISTLVSETGTKLTIPMHDYYAICPSYTLLNDKGHYCDIPSLETCKACMENNTQEWRNFHPDKVNLDIWRDTWFELLSKSQNILCFSNASKNILLKSYPNLKDETIQVIPHETKTLPPVQTREKDNTTITIGILGAINYAKGSQVIKQLVQTIERDTLDMKVVIVGEMTEAIKSKHFHMTGRYNRDELPQMIKDEKIDIFMIPSIWPETFSYTTQEIMMMEMPLMVFNLGAPAERVKNYSNGYIIDEVSSNAILALIKKLQAKNLI